MYNKLFTKILDSSIWLEPCPTRVVWITLIASMDEDSYCHFSAIENLARRAGVTDSEAKSAVECFLKPDPNSGDPDHEGRRIERVPGGFLVLNGPKYRDIYNRIRDRENTNNRVRRFRERNGNVTVGNGVKQKVTVKPHAEAEAYSEAEVQKETRLSAEADAIYLLFPRKVARPKAIKAIRNAITRHSLEIVKASTVRFSESWSTATPEELKFCPHPTTWFGQDRFNDSPETWRQNGTNQTTRGFSNGTNRPSADHSKGF